MIEAFFISAALMNQSCESIMQSDHSRATVTVEMSADKTITVRTVDPRVPDFPVEQLNPGSPNYIAIEKMIGGISPGESKVMPEFIGRVDMSLDGTLTYEYWGAANNGSPLNGRESARPGDKNYPKILSLVGHLEPGDWAMVKATPCDNQRR